MMGTVEGGGEQDSGEGRRGGMASCTYRCSPGTRTGRGVQGSGRMACTRSPGWHGPAPQALCQPAPRPCGRCSLRAWPGVCPSSPRMRALCALVWRQSWWGSRAAALVQRGQRLGHRAWSSVCCQLDMSPGCHSPASFSAGLTSYGEVLAVPRVHGLGLKARGSCDTFWDFHSRLGFLYLVPTSAL